MKLFKRALIIGLGLETADWLFDFVCHYGVKTKHKLLRYMYDNIDELDLSERTKEKIRNKFEKKERQRSTVEGFYRVS